MNTLTRFLIAGVVGFFIAMFIAPMIIKVAKRLKAGQSILSYVNQHNGKEGTPTFGGFIFIIPTIITWAIFGGYKSSLATTFILILFAYGVIGFLDDFIKVKTSKNEGLKPYQKIIAQLAVAIIASFFSAKNEFVGESIALNFGAEEWFLGDFYIPFAVVTFIAMSNAVNLTDGLDGLAGGTVSIYMTTFVVIIITLFLEATSLGNTLYANEMSALCVSVTALIGGLLAFLWFNSSKASVFMGDTGSLALGGACASVALFVRNPLISILVGIMFVVSCISVIVQVLSFKIRKKRVFLMAPFHHHLELQGVNEEKIVAYYSIITALAGVVALIII